LARKPAKRPKHVRERMYRWNSKTRRTPGYLPADRPLKPRPPTEAAGKYRLAHQVALQARISYKTAGKAWDEIWDAIKAFLVCGGENATVQLFPYRDKLGKSGIGRFTRKRHPRWGYGYVAWKRPYGWTMFQPEDVDGKDTL
jgi:hypothetical protein